MGEDAFSQIFLNRSEEKRFFESQLQRIVTHPSMPKRILNYWGVGGIGKTALLKHRFKEVVKNQPGDQQWYFAYLDFEPFPAINRSAITNFPTYLDAMEEALGEAGLELEYNKEYEDENHRATILANKLQDKLTSAYLVLVFDGLTQARNWFSKLEQYFLSPLLSQSKNVLLVVGSRSPIRFERFELRMQLAVYQLLALEQNRDKKLTTNLLETLRNKFQIVSGDEDNLNLVAEKVQNLSKGHPQTLIYILEEKIPDSLPQTIDLLTSKEEKNKIQIDLLNFVLDRYAYLSNTSETAARQLRFAISEIASYNRFDLKLLELALVWAIEPEVRSLFEANRYNAPFFSELLKSMLNTRMIDWETMQRGYVLDHTYREIILNGLEVKDELVFRQRHKNAARHYLTILNSKQGDEETRAMYVCEILYHLTKAFVDDEISLRNWLIALNGYIDSATWPDEAPYQPIAPEAVIIVDSKSLNRPTNPPSRIVIAKVFSTYKSYRDILDPIQSVDRLNFNWLLSNETKAS